MRGVGTKAVALGAAAAMLVGVSGCQLKDSGDNLVNGKQLFVQKCGSCHTLARAGTTASTGPNLDEAFQRARHDGFRDSTFEGIVHRQIANPNTRTQVDPRTGKATAKMPAKLVKGDDAQDVAAYVAQAAAKRGEDSGQLAQLGVKKSTKAAREKNGVLEIPTNPNGGNLFAFGSAEAQAGEITVRSPNKQSIGHDIAIEGNGVNEKGEVVSNGGVSEFKATVRPGTYTFFCSVPGHREAGMEGKLTVK
jgi:plastocyanin